MPSLLLFSTLDLKENFETLVEKSVLILSSGSFYVSMLIFYLHQLTDGERNVWSVE